MTDLETFFNKVNPVTYLVVMLMGILFVPILWGMVASLSQMFSNKKGRR
jgi:hypothetical protein